jgi:hypothetical protein
MTRNPLQVRRWLGTVSILAAHGATTALIADFGLLRLPRWFVALAHMLDVNFLSALFVARPECLFSSITHESLDMWIGGLSAAVYLVPLLLLLIGVAVVLRFTSSPTRFDQLVRWLTVLVALQFSTLFGSLDRAFHLTLFFSHIHMRGEFFGLSPVPFYVALYVLEGALAAALMATAARIHRDVRDYSHGIHTGVWRLPAQRLDSRLHFITRRFAAKAPFHQFAVWARQLALLACGSETLAWNAQSWLGLPWLQSALALCVLVLALTYHISLQPFAFAFQNALETWLLRVSWARFKPTLPNPFHPEPPARSSYAQRKCPLSSMMIE